MRSWNIYYRDREYAREHGDPLLGVIEAHTKEQAERLASKRGLGGMAGVWAYRELTSNSPSLKDQKNQPSRQTSPVERFRQCELAFAREKLREAEEQSARGESGPLDADGLKLERLAANGVTDESNC